MADIIHVSLSDFVSKSDRPLYEGRLLDLATGEWIGRELGRSQRRVCVAHPFTAAGTHARGRDLRHHKFQLVVRKRLGAESESVKLNLIAASSTQEAWSRVRGRGPAMSGRGGEPNSNGSSKKYPAIEGK